MRHLIRKMIVSKRRYVWDQSPMDGDLDLVPDTSVVTMLFISLGAALLYC